MIAPFAFLPNIGPMEIVILVVLGILLFGKKLPDMGRYLGKSIVEFKKGVKGIEDDVDGVGPARQETGASEARPPQRVAASAPKFEDAPQTAAQDPYADRMK